MQGQMSGHSMIWLAIVHSAARLVMVVTTNQEACTQLLHLCYGVNTLHRLPTYIRVRLRYAYFYLAATVLHKKITCTFIVHCVSWVKRPPCFIITHSLCPTWSEYWRTWSCLATPRNTTSTASVIRSYKWVIPMNVHLWDVPYMWWNIYTLYTYTCTYRSGINRYPKLCIDT